jgi:predicted RNase H-like HicB family nuclease
MGPPKLPADLTAFLREGRQLDYNPSLCEAGRIELIPARSVRLHLFPMDCQSTPVEADDPHRRELGCYLVRAVNLVARCEHYLPEGLLMWFPDEGRYGNWDSEHHGICLFHEDVTWRKVSESPDHFLDLNWHSWDEDDLECLVPWPRYPYCEKQIHDPVIPLPGKGEKERMVLRYHAIYRNIPEGVHAEVVDFPGAITSGATVAEARYLLRNALQDLAEFATEEGSPLPVPDEFFRDIENVADYCVICVGVGYA